MISEVRYSESGGSANLVDVFVLGPPFALEDPDPLADDECAAMVMPGLIEAAPALRLKGLLGMVIRYRCTAQGRGDRISSRRRVSVPLPLDVRRERKGK